MFRGFSSLSAVFERTLTIPLYSRKPGQTKDTTLGRASACKIRAPLSPAGIICHRQALPALQHTIRTRRRERLHEGNSTTSAVTSDSWQRSMRVVH